MKTFTLKRGNRYKLDNYRNDVETWRVSLTDEQGDAVDLTGGAVYFRAKVSPFDSTLAFELLGTVIGAETLGIVEFAIDIAQTGLVRKYIAEIQIEDAVQVGNLETHVVFDYEVSVDVQ